MGYNFKNIINIILKIESRNYFEIQYFSFWLLIGQLSCDRVSIYFIFVQPSEYFKGGENEYI